MGSHWGIGAGIAILAVTATGHAQEARPFHLEEATIESVHQAFAARRLTCVQLTRPYLDRIEAYNLSGPTLRAILTVNPRALETAAEMDRAYAANPVERRAAALRSRSCSRTISTPPTCRRPPATSA